MKTSNFDIHRFFHKKEDAEDFLSQRVAELRHELAAANPRRLAANTGSSYQSLGENRGEFTLPIWGRSVAVSYPDYVARYRGADELLDTFSMALLAYYFHTADGTSTNGSWIAFSELPDGRFYAQAFQGYTGARLAGAFGNDLDALERAAASIGGRPVTFGDRAFSFQVLPYVPLLVTCWLGDEDFPSSYRILFDAAAGHHLTTDACAVVGSTLTRRLIRAGQVS
jgi:hypothetical protein